MNPLFLKDLADKTRRGLRGLVELGRSGGGLCYGYKVRRAPHERAARGEREIVPAEAEVVRRIFRDYSAGMSPKSLAKRLNAERCHGPGGSPWNPSTIQGNPGRGTGILNNELYRDDSSGIACDTSRIRTPGSVSRGQTLRLSG
jgi:site-specific DNA recombinase